MRKSSSSSDPRETKEAAQTGKASVGKDEPEKLVSKTKHKLINLGRSFWLHGSSRLTYFQEVIW